MREDIDCGITNHECRLQERIQFLSQGAIIRVPTYRRYAKFMVWYFFVFSQVPRRYAEIYYSCTYIFLLAITSKPAKVFKTVKNFSCTCKFHASDIFWDENAKRLSLCLIKKIIVIVRLKKNRSGERF
jgi:hypothetical protein